MSEDPPKRRPGRPKTPNPKVALTTWVSVSTYDQLAAHARRREESVSALVRTVLRRRLEREPER